MPYFESRASICQLVERVNQQKRNVQLYRQQSILPEIIAKQQQQPTKKWRENIYHLLVELFLLQFAVGFFRRQYSWQWYRWHGSLVLNFLECCALKFCTTAKPNVFFLCVCLSFSFIVVALFYVVALWFFCFRCKCDVRWRMQINDQADCVLCKLPKRMSCLVIHLICRHICHSTRMNE